MTKLQKTTQKWKKTFQKNWREKQEFFKKTSLTLPVKNICFPHLIVDFWDNWICTQLFTSNVRQFSIFVDTSGIKIASKSPGYNAILEKLS
jgi:hypothetical protein